MLKTIGWKRVFIAMAVAIGIAMPIMSLDAGNSGDEDGWNYPQSLHLYEYYTSWGKDTSYINSMKLEYSGWAFDTATIFVIKALNIDDYMTARHIMNALVGALLMLFVGLFARLVGGWRAGCFALLLIFFSPQIVGQSLNNPKDIPFAACMMGAIYYIAWFIREYPRPSWRTVIKLGIMMGATVGIRPGGFLLIPYFGLFILTYYLIINKPKHYFIPPNTAIIQNILLRAVAAIAIMTVVMLILWPYALHDPLHNIVSSFKTASSFPAILRQMYEGKMIWGDQFPWHYTLKYICITSPIAVLMGVIVQLFVARKQKNGYFWTFVLLFCFAFPIFWIVYSKAIIYGGWRHSTFAYPTLAVAAGLGFSALVDIAKNKYVKMVLTALPFLLLLNPIIFTVKNHPYEYVYFNRFVGGIKGAYGNYEMDYYYHSTREMSEWVKKDVQENGAPDSTRKTKIVSWHGPSVQYFFRHDTVDFSCDFSRWYERGFNDWDYGVFTITGMLPELLKNKRAFPPKNTVYQVKVDGVPIAIVLKREDKSDYYGHKAMKEGRIGEAVAYLKQALAYDPYNEQALEDLITVYPQIGMPDSALALAQRWVAFNKGNTTALNQLANLYYAQGKYSNATLVAGSILKYNSRDISGLWISAHAYAEQGQLDNALRNLQKLLTIRGDYTPAYEFMAELFERAGDKRQAQEIRNALR